MQRKQKKIDVDKRITKQNRPPMAHAAEAGRRNLHSSAHDAALLKTVQKAQSFPRGSPASPAVRFKQNRTLLLDLWRFRVIRKNACVEKAGSNPPRLTHANTDTHTTLISRPASLFPVSRAALRPMQRSWLPQPPSADPCTNTLGAAATQLSRRSGRSA